jgi:YidC/Oxa1 family membrane protein insertase
MKDTDKSNNIQMQAAMQNNMAFISPIISGVIAFTVPAGLGLYWIIGNLYQIVQQMFMNRFVSKKHTDRNKQTETRNSRELHQTDAQ